MVSISFRDPVLEKARELLHLLSERNESIVETAQAACLAEDGIIKLGKMTDLIENHDVVKVFRDFRAQINLRSREHMIPYTGSIHYLGKKNPEAPRVIFQAAAAILARDNIRFPDAPEKSRVALFQSIASVEYESRYPDIYKKVTAALGVAVHAYQPKLIAA